MSLLKKERERHCHPTARAPSSEDKFSISLLKTSDRFLVPAR
jgi:hypothetical protein